MLVGLVASAVAGVVNRRGRFREEGHDAIVNKNTVGKIFGLVVNLKIPDWQTLAFDAGAHHSDWNKFLADWDGSDEI